MKHSIQQMRLITTRNNLQTAAANARMCRKQHQEAASDLTHMDTLHDEAFEYDMVRDDYILIVREEAFPL